jgi:transmembrane sensor
MKRYRRNNSDSVPEQAAEWLLELAEPPNGMDSRRQFMNWLKKSPQHIEEFLAVASLQQEVAEQTSAVADILADLKSMADRPAVPLFGTPAVASTAVKKVHRRGRHYLLWASAASLALIAFILLQLPDVEPPVVSHTTELGEQRSIVLDDGSIVTLNTLSEAAVRFDTSTRQVTLVSGEALFDVVSDPGRPFVVETGTISLNVLGTKFSVYRRNDSTRVAVVEGSVRAVSRQTPDEPIVVRAGEGAVATAQGISLADPRFDVGKAIAWTERRLVFDGAPLAEVVREFNRYNRKPLIVEDGTLANRAITTVVNAHDVSALVGFLELEPDVEVEYADDSIRIRVRH